MVAVAVASGLLFLAPGCSYRVRSQSLWCWQLPRWSVLQCPGCRPLQSFQPSPSTNSLHSAPPVGKTSALAQCLAQSPAWREWARNCNLCKEDKSCPREPSVWLEREEAARCHSKAVLACFIRLGGHVFTIICSSANVLWPTVYPALCGGTEVRQTTLPTQ